jgi:hypothetical protein
MEAILTVLTDLLTVVTAILLGNTNGLLPGQDLLLVANPLGVARAGQARPSTLLNHLLLQNR